MMNNTVISQLKCPSCGKRKVVTEENSGDLFCEFCGFVIHEKLEDYGAEWRTFSNEDSKRTRVGAGTSLLMHDMGLSTIIGIANKDSTGKTLSASMKSSI